MRCYNVVIRPSRYYARPSDSEVLGSLERPRASAQIGLFLSVAADYSAGVLQFERHHIVDLALQADIRISEPNYAFQKGRPGAPSTVSGINMQMVKERSLRPHGSEPHHLVPFFGDQDVLTLCFIVKVLDGDWSLVARENLLPSQLINCCTSRTITMTKLSNLHRLIAWANRPAVSDSGSIH